VQLTKTFAVETSRSVQQNLLNNLLKEVSYSNR